MCVIICCETKFPVKNILKDAESHNNDGAGVAWLGDDKRVRYRKGITAEKINKMIDEEKIKLPCIIHFRLTSCGNVTDELTHPFPITAQAETKLKGITKAVLFHNGTWRLFEDRLFSTHYRNTLYLLCLRLPS